ncbi:MAG: hypothetical protein F6K65_40060, partial [Moorea sp. SIO3C2]|nr:hypothetical protein [Moorena sp. SIO3C2]
MKVLDRQQWMLMVAGLALLVSLGGVLGHSQVLPSALAARDGGQSPLLQTSFIQAEQAAK